MKELNYLMILILSTFICERSLCQTEEINLSPDYYESVSRENEILQSNILATINKWHFELYPDKAEANIPYLVAILMDSVTYELTEQLKELLNGSSTPTSQVSIINNWVNQNFEHTQANNIFENLPGNDPWGIMNYNPFGGKFAVPSYKKLLPSEMKAMSIYTGKICGKCITLANLMCSIMKCIGVNSKNLLTFQILIDGTMNHGYGIVKFNDVLFLFNNTSVSIINDTVSPWMSYGDYKYLSMYNHLITKEIPDSFTEQSFFTQTESGTFFNYLDIEEEKIDDELKIISNLSTRNEILSIVIKNQINSNWYSLAKYSYQSLYVKRPELYLEASLRTSCISDLSNELETYQNVFEWISSKISYGSIFYDQSERLMTAEQVIVFGKGTYKDQAMLASALLYKLEISNRIHLGRYCSYIEFENKIIDVSTWQEIDRIDEQIVLLLDRESSFYTGIDKQLSGTLVNYSLHQNYPNPFNSSTILKYNLQKPSNVILKIYNVSGQELETLLKKYQTTGEYEINWQPNNLPSGLYFYRLQYDEFSETKKLIFLK